MKYLAIDTSNTHVSIAVAVDERFFSATLPVVNGHSEETLPLIQRLLTDSGIGLAELDGIIYGQGPGAFTGLRIGCGIAQGLALAHDLPLIPVPTLDVIAFQSGVPAVQVVMDARMNEVYTASYRDGVALTPITLQARGELTVPADIPVLAGDCAQELTCPGKTVYELRPDAASYIRLVRRGGYAAVAPEAAGLLYIRDKVALTAAEQQARKHG
ncbi:tRNA threonylcarbamoyladenosine biosynthesis protein TsaB [Vogesella indigofera]|uniref:tRNA threonylcarbamoyladenosine biosynthesis protein TsaB n=1 Tax=Vogesella indigofera TaxID=45465 RepID=A0A495B312_VOGIN|nr:tRNA (adenosine(37)-N6)-threonylcarbamoyltransferase complex dimerization subunit type 1 TsaB [Vogesella indigofera]RKQ55336.1 tRNA threonylcarbamoyladenosine biosynthesis protein TsaB [Vogesella indigofera]